MAFDRNVHEMLTRSAIKVYHDCQQLAPEEASRHGVMAKELQDEVVRWNGEQDGVFVTLIGRFFDWHFYNTNQVTDQGWVRHFMDRVFERRRQSLETAAARNRPAAELYVRAGAVMHYLQDVSSPPHVVPVYHWKVGPFGVPEPYDGFLIDEMEERYAGELAVTPGQCRELLAWEGSFPTLLAAEAAMTLAAVDEAIPAPNNPADHPFKWNAFWRPRGDSGPQCHPEEDLRSGFGSHGRFCQDFGRGSLDTDPALPGTPAGFRINREQYERFALARFIRARNSSVKALAWAGRKALSDEPPASGKGSDT